MCGCVSVLITAVTRKINALITRAQPVSRTGFRLVAIRQERTDLCLKASETEIVRVLRRNRPTVEPANAEAHSLFSGFWTTLPGHLQGKLRAFAMHGSPRAGAPVSQAPSLKFTEIPKSKPHNCFFRSGSVFFISRNRENHENPGYNQRRLIPNM